MENNTCPCCHNHCSKDNLSCNRGRDYFNNLDNPTPKTLNELVISDLKICGHMLHHNKNLDTNNILSNLKNDELTVLHELLTKIYSNINK